MARAKDDSVKKQKNQCSTIPTIWTVGARQLPSQSIELANITASGLRFGRVGAGRPTIDRDAVLE